MAPIAPLFAHPPPGLRTIHHIPKPARAACAAALADTLDGVVNEPQSTKAWTALLHFGSLFLHVTERGGKRWNISSILLKRLNTGPTSADDHSDLPTIHCKSDADSARAAAISTKLEEGNITAAVMILWSDDSPADFSSSNLDRLRGKHPSEHAGARPSANPMEKPALQVSEIAVLKVVRSFPAGSTGVSDGIRPQHLLELVQYKEMGNRLLTSLTAFVNSQLDERCHKDFAQILFGGRLLAME